MKALTWQAKRTIEYSEVPDPRIEKPDDIIIRGGTISLSGVYSGQATTMPLLQMFDKQIQLREGQCNVRSWTDKLMPFAEDPADPLGPDDLVTHTVPLSRGPEL